MGLFRELSRKPWISEPGAGADLEDGGTFFLSTEKLGLRIFLAVVTVLFSLTVIAYSDRTTFPDWHSFPVPWLLWLNTVLLILGSVALQRARTSARHDNLDGVRSGLFAGGALTFAFLVGQILVWRQLAAAEQFAPTDPAVDFFYMISGLHGLHMLGGLVAWWRTMAKLRSGMAVADLAPSVDLCTAYWHYLLMIWLVVFGLLLFT